MRDRVAKTKIYQGIRQLLQNIKRAVWWPVAKLAVHLCDCTCVQVWQCAEPYVAESNRLRNMC